MRKKLTYTLIMNIFMVTIFIFQFQSCGGNKHKINVKKDFEYYYSVIEKSFLMAVDGIRKKQINKSLDKIEAYVAKENHNLKMVGVRLNSILLSEKESFYIIDYNRKYVSLAGKYLSFIERHYNTEQRNRFIKAVVTDIVHPMMDQLKVPKSSMDMLKKAFR